MANCPLYVLGRTRVGKGEFIAQAYFHATGKQIFISSDQMGSHTTKLAMFPVRNMMLGDTVGYDDTHHGDIKGIMDLLARAKKSAFYPPLMIVSTLGSSDVEWIKKLVQIFPKIVFAVRGKKKRFQSAQSELLKFKPLKIFHLHEYIDDEDEKVESTSRKTYNADVNTIIEFYCTIKPSREDLKFDSKIFKGTIDKQCTKTESKVDTKTISNIKKETEEKSVKEETTKTVPDGGHYEIRKVRRSTEDRVVSGIITAPLLGVGSWFSHKDQPVWVPDEKTVVIENWKTVSVNVQYRETKTYANTFERKHFDVWKKLLSGISIFMETEISPWKEKSSRLIESRVERI